MPPRRLEVEINHTILRPPPCPACKQARSWIGGLTHNRANKKVLMKKMWVTDPIRNNHTILKMHLFGGTRPYPLPSKNYPEKSILTSEALIIHVFAPLLAKMSWQICCCAYTYSKFSYIFIHKTFERKKLVLKLQKMPQTF